MMRMSNAPNRSATPAGPAPRLDPHTEAANCVPNIGPAEQSRRLRFGLQELGIGLALGALLIVTGVNPWWRLILFVPFAAAAIGFFQARDKT